MPGRVRTHYAGDYQRRARLVRLRADADPTTRCWRCGLTKAEHGQPWDAGHLNDGQAGGPLAAECRRCNRSSGAAMGNRMRKGLRTSRRW